MKLLYPDYDNCLVNLACSVEKAFGVSPEHSTLPLCDRLLSGKQYKNVIALVLDGCGMAILEKNAQPEGFFRRHLAGEYISVFPPTTVAATTSVQSGLTPAEHGWLGWDVYFPEVDNNITVFRNTLTGTDTPAADYNVAQTHRPYKSIVEKIRENGGNAYFATPFDDPFPQTWEEIEERLRLLCAQPEHKFIYCYWPEPDHIMHQTGVDSEPAKATLRELESRLEALRAQLEDTLLLITADHGQLNSTGDSVEAHPELGECLLRGISIEPRAVAFFVKEGMETLFETRFRAAFGDQFLLLTREEVIKMRLFGIGEEQSGFRGSVGDYLAVSTGSLSLYPTREDATHFIGVHAGLTADEMRLPLIAVDC